MAYYDSFTKKPRDKREDLRDDTFTRRPARDSRNGQERAGRGEDGYDQERRPYGRRSERAPGSRFQREEGGTRRSRMTQGEGRSFGAPAARTERRVPRERQEESRQERPAYRGLPMSMEESVQENLLVGRNPIREALKSGRDLEKLIVAKGEIMGSGREIVAMAHERKIVIQEVDRVRLDAMAPGHQGMIAVASAYAYGTVDGMLELAASRGEAPFLVVLDGITDPHNLGAIIRSAECAGAHGVIIPERRAVGLTPAAVKASAGAVEHIPVAKETNLVRTLERLKKEGIWIFGAAMDGEDYRKMDFSGPAALVIGSEGDGISRLVREHCDRIVSLPVKGKIESLNASVAAGILLYAMSAARD